MTRDEIVSIIEAAAAQEGVPVDALLAIASIESSGNVNAKNPRSSASGLFQFTNDTAADYGLTGSKRNDPTAQAYAAAKMMATNQQAMTRDLGREPSAGELYLAHQQGLAGATALLRNPGRPAAEVLARFYKTPAAAAEAVRLNGGAAGVSAGDFAAKWVNKANERVARTPPGSIPNAVGSEVSVTPRKVTGFPTPLPVNPANPPLPRDRPQRMADVPLPRLDPRKPNRMDIAAGGLSAERALPPIFVPGGRLAGEERGPATTQRKAQTATASQIEAATGFRLPGQSSSPQMSRQEQRADNGQGTPAMKPRVALASIPGPAAAPKTQDRLDTGQVGVTPRAGTVQATRQQVEQGTGFRLGKAASPLVKEVEVENPAYAALARRVAQGEIEMRGISPSGMAMSRDARSRYDASKKALEEAQTRLAQMQRTVTVQQTQRQAPAPLKIVVQADRPSGGNAGTTTSSPASSFQGTSSGKTYTPGQQYQMGNDTYTANANGGFTNDRTGRTQGTGSTYYDTDSNTFKKR